MMGLTMESMKLLEAAKTTLRLKGTAFDGEVAGLIAAAIADMRRAGLTFTDEQAESAPLLVRGVLLYCKGHYGYIPGNERFIKAYDGLLVSLKVSGDYDAME